MKATLTLIPSCLQAYANNFRMPDGSVYVSSGVKPPPGAPHLTGSTEEIETLRPRSPPSQPAALTTAPDQVPSPQSFRHWGDNELVDIG